MKTAKVFVQDNSQAVRLPKEFQFQVDEVYIRREGEALILMPKPAVRWRHVKACLGAIQEELPRKQTAGFDEREW